MSNEPQKVTIDLRLAVVPAILSDVPEVNVLHLFVQGAVIRRRTLLRQICFRTSALSDLTSHEKNRFKTEQVPCPKTNCSMEADDMTN